ncbi:polyketide synthase [Nostoc sp. UHCC 0251]|uniref:polyketide synthase n=1 Tax=Nostoc sp. UHCC 0251 TaxID=3110240 RepID=UPI002B1F0619|nr:polyketide synthase [Nostoc sp. UHCC 0251]MEA5621832.1 beta-ketoacyl synthase N-terminal-like domain-containing protein [Nostoc sp. UHCC 0251]
MSQIAENNNGELSLSRLLLALKQARTSLEIIENQNKEPIAVVGVGCRFPGGVKNPEDFWHLLCHGVNTITEVPADRWHIDAFYDKDPNIPGKMYTRYGGFLNEVDKFDPQFFGISPREAISIDPQQRVLLEVSWEALENAGQAPDGIRGSKTGVFFGISSDDYSRLSVNSGDLTQIDAYSSLGNARSISVGRLSYLLGLHGPSIQVDTACSSSLLAIHLACQSLRNQECNMALAGGVNLMLTPEMTISLCKLNALSTGDRCKTFDATADGYVRGEGCGIIVLKRLSDAIANNDTILSLIRSSATNHDGNSNGLTAPNGSAQEALIRQALENANVQPSQVQYVEAHGTGTPLGDPIEVLALAKIFSQGRAPSEPLLIGSVKTNIGHLEAAAGVAGLIKVVLALQNRQLPPHLHLQTPNPYIPWEKLSISVPTQLTHWPTPSASIADEQPGKRLAGVSAFGLSGTNVHILLEEAPEAVQAQENLKVERPLHLLTLSAKSDLALQQLVGEYEQLIANYSSISIADLSFTANTGRVHFQHRLAIVAQTTDQLSEQMQAFQSGRKLAGLLNGRTSQESPKVAFLFTGQGSQYVGMGRQLYETQATFRQEINRCQEILLPYMDKPLLEILYPKTEESSLLNETVYTQPALFALEYALAKLWQSWGVEPAAVMGHSVGEYVAACLAGVFSLEDGLKLIAKRGELLQSLPTDGEMVVVFSNASQVTTAIQPYAQEVSIAALNGPENVVISGRRKALNQIISSLTAQGIKTVRLSVSHAFHSPLVEPLQAKFETVAAEVTYSTPKLCLISNVSGEIATTEIATPEYWWEHMRQPVKFAAGMETLHNLGYQILLEIGPKSSLLNMGRRCFPTEEKLWLPSLAPEQPDWQQMLVSLSSLYVQGVAVNWFGFDKGYPRRRMQIPTYPWQRSRYWLDKRKANSSVLPADALQLWLTAKSAGFEQSQQAPLDLAIHTYPAKHRLLESLTNAYIIETLSKFGVYTQADERYSVDSLLTQLNISPNYRQLLLHWLKRLTQLGLLQQEQEETFVSKCSLPNCEIDVLLQEMSEVFADVPLLLNYFQNCGSQLTKILTGQKTALETLFPGGSLDTAEYLYQKWAVARYFNGIASRILESIVRVLPSDKPLRILEIGAGTGGTTVSLLPLLPPERTRYYFTDLSDFFFVRAREKFKAYPFVHYGVLNIEESPEAAAYSLHSFDVVVATNVLHATHNLDETLEHVYSLLAPGGILLLNEVTNHVPWFDISTRLIEGWQRFDDSWRQDNPLLSRERWQEALQKHGFEHTAAFPQAGATTEELGQHIIIAQTPGNLVDSAIGISTTIEESNLTTVSSPESPTLSVALQPTLSRASLIAADSQLWQQQVSAYLCQQIGKALSIPSAELAQEQLLNEIGFDSLVAVELRYRVEADLAVSLPTSGFLQNFSITTLSKYVLEQLTSDLSIPSGSATTNSLSPSWKHSLIHIQTNGSKPPLVCIHPGGLDVSCYHNLARHLDHEQPLYALQPLELDHYYHNNGHQTPVPAYSIEEMAARCLEVIKKLQPEGPYYLGGWSLGGCVAFEIAQQIRQQGHQVALLALLDVSNSPPNNENSILLPWFASYLGARRNTEFSFNYETSHNLNLDQQLSNLLHQAIKADVLASETQLADIHHLFSAYKTGVQTSLQQVQQYDLQTYSDCVTLFQASKTLNQFNVMNDQPQQLWNRLSQVSIHNLKTYVVPGDHYTMWLEPYVQTLAQSLQNSLKQAEQFAKQTISVLV